MPRGTNSADAQACSFSNFVRCAEWYPKISHRKALSRPPDGRFLHKLQSLMYFAGRSITSPDAMASVVPPPWHRVCSRDDVSDVGSGSTAGTMTAGGWAEIKAHWHSRAAARSPSGAPRRHAVRSFTAFAAARHAGRHSRLCSGAKSQTQWSSGPFSGPKKTKQTAPWTTGPLNLDFNYRA